MDMDQSITLLVLVGALVLFITEAFPLGVTGLLIIAALGVGQVFDSYETAVSAFASPAVVLVASLYVVSSSLIRTGIVNAIGQKMLGRGSELQLLIVSTLVAALVSSLLNNTSVVVLMIPLLLGASSRLGVPPSRLLMPVSFGSILGGTMTLIGTSTNVLVVDLASHATGETVGFFDFLPLGAAFVGVGLLYLWTVGRRLLPARQTVSSVTRGRAFDYVTELLVPQGSPVIGMTPAELVRRASEGIRILQLVHDEEVLNVFDNDRKLVEGDLLVLRGTPEAIVSMRRELKLSPLPGVSAEGTLAEHGTTFAEIVITPISQLIDRTLSQVGLHRRLGVLAVALQRRGAHLRHGITEIRLQIGDVILVQGDPKNVDKLRQEPGLLLLVGVEEHVTLRGRAPIAIGILAAFVALAATRWIPIPLAGIAAAAACLATGCISLSRAVREINWDVLGLLAGVITLGTALSGTGLASEAAGVLVSWIEHWGPVAVLSAIYLLTSIATEFVSNSGAAAVLLPIALATAEQMGVSARPFMFAVAYGASASFSTPIGYQTNAFVYGPGGYRFADYLRVGLPLQVLLWILASALIPHLFPF
jgi:di/tricarboxylate transporter